MIKLLQLSAERLTVALLLLLFPKLSASGPSLKQAVWLPAGKSKVGLLILPAQREANSQPSTVQSQLKGSFD